MLSRRRFLALALSLPAGAAVACGGPTGNALERARQAGTIRIGIAGEQPYGYTDAGGRVTGAQPEVARTVLARLGVPALAAVQVPFDQLLDGLERGQFDLVAAGMTVTPGRCARVAFSRPDFVAPPAFLVRRGNPRRIRTFDDVARKRVRLAVLAGAAEIDYARAAGVSADQLQVVGGQSELFRAVAGGDVTAGALTAISLADESRRNPGSDVEITGPVTPMIDGRAVVPGAAFAVRTGEQELLAAFDTELAALQASGEWLRITARFGMRAENLPPGSLTTAALCRPPS